MKKRITSRDFSMGFVLLFLVAFFAVTIPDNKFLSPQNFSHLSIELAITASLALGMFLALLPGQIDLSAGSGVALLGGLSAVMITQYHLSPVVALPLTLLIGVVIWSLMGSLIICQRIPAFIITLGGLLILRGVHQVVIHNKTIPIVEGGKENLYSLITTYYIPPAVGYLLALVLFASFVVMKIKAHRERVAHQLPTEDKELVFLKFFVLGQALFLLTFTLNQHKGIPCSLLLLGGVFLLVYTVTNHTRLGRYLYAIGSNETAAKLSGIPVTKVVIFAFALLGLIVSLTGLMQTAYGGFSTPTLGNLMELDAIAACVIGGTSLRGGRGTILGVLFGALIMAVLLNGMTLHSVSPEIKLIVRGAVLIAAVWMDVSFNRKKI